MEEGNDLRKREVYYSENYLRFREKSAIMPLFIYGVGIYVLFALEIMEGGLDYGKRKYDNYCRLGSARLGSARLGRSIAPFFQRVKSYFIQFITNRLPETGRIMPWLRLFAFAGRMVV